MQLLHLADVHLDRPFVRADRRQGDRDRARLRSTFSKCLELARKREVDLVTIGGDLWEDEHVSADTRRFVAAELGSIDCPVLMICGNHDPLRPGGHYERTSWPTNAHIFDRSAPTEYRVSDEVSIWGVSWTPNLDTGFLRTEIAPTDGRVHLLLLHGTALTAAPVIEESYAPFDPAHLRGAGFSFCLAGHIHQAALKNDLVYPGSPEPLDWGEMGRHCIALVTAAEGRVEPELIDINDHRYEERPIDCAGCEHGEEVGERLANLLTDADADRIHLRTVLDGQVARECRVDIEHLLERHQEGYAELVVQDQTYPHYDFEALAEQPTATGHFIKDLRERIDAAEDPEESLILEQALTAGLRALEGREDVIRAL